MGEPETVTIRLANAQQTSAGYSSPGDVVQLPGEEAYGLVRSGLAEVVSVP